MISGEEFALNTFCSFTKFKSIKPALLLLSNKSTMRNKIACLEAAPSKRQPNITLAASGPTTEILSGLPLGYSIWKVKGGTGLACMYEKCLSTISITSSGTKSPTIITAILLGT